MQDREGQRIRGVSSSGFHYDGVVGFSSLQGHTAIHEVDLLEPLVWRGKQHWKILVRESDEFYVIEQVN